MSDEFELNATVRTDLGKGASRRLRRINHDIPAVIYGGGKDPVSLTIAHKDIAKATENEAFFSHIITLNVGNEKEQAVIKDLQRHPARPFIMHADFMRVSAKQVIHVKVPLHFLNEEKCVGVKTGGGNLLKTMTELEVACLPKDLPEYLEVDMLLVDVGDSVHISDVTLPEGVTSVALSHEGEDNDLAIATIQAPKGGSDEDDEAEEAAAAAASAADEVEATKEKKDKDKDKDKD